MPWILYKTQQPTDGSPSSVMALSNGHWSGFIMSVASVQKAKVSAVFFPAVFLLHNPEGGPPNELLMKQRTLNWWRHNPEVEKNNKHPTQHPVSLQCYFDFIAPTSEVYFVPFATDQLFIDSSSLVSKNANYSSLCKLLWCTCVLDVSLMDPDIHTRTVITEESAEQQGLKDLFHVPHVSLAILASTNHKDGPPSVHAASSQIAQGRLNNRGIPADTPVCSVCSLQTPLSFF